MSFVRWLPPMSALPTWRPASPKPPSSSAHPLDEDNRKLLEEKIATLTGMQQVHATYSEDAALLGGAVVTIGSTVYDGSIRAQLQQLKARMVSAGA